MQPIILYDNRFRDGTPVATDEAPGFSVLNIKDFRTYTFWKGASAGTKEIKVNCGSAKSAECLGLTGTNLKTANATISVESSPDDVIWTERLAGFTPSKDGSVVKTFTQATAQWWKIKIITASVAAKIAVSFLGGKLQFPYPPETPHPPYSEGIKAETMKGKTGHPLGATVSHKPREIIGEFRNLSRDFVFNTYKPFWDGHASELLPFFYVEDLTAYPDDAAYVMMKDTARFEPDLSLGGLVDSIILPMDVVAA